MTYNVLDLPLSYTKGNTQVEWKYSAEGVKLQEKTTVTAGGQSSVTTVDHVGDFVLTDGALTRVDFAGGFADMTGSSPALFFFLTDHLGSVRVVADAQGNVHQVNHYYPYGDRFTDPRYTVSSSGAGSDNGRLFAGKEQEGSSGLYDFEARFDNTFLGRFTTMDPMAEKYYSISPYAYCGGDPVNLVDPEGMWVYIYYNKTQYRYNEGVLQKYIGLNDNNEELFADIEPDEGSFLRNVLEALNSIASLSYTGSQLISYFSGNQRNAYIHQNELSDENITDLEGTSNPIYLNPAAKGGLIPVEGGIRQSPFWLDVAHELAHRQDVLVRGNKAALSPWLTFENGDIIHRSELYATHVENQIREEAGLPLRTHYATFYCVDSRFTLPVESTRLISPAGYSIYFPGQKYKPYIMRFKNHR